MPYPNQLQLFHPMSYDGLPVRGAHIKIIDKRENPHWPYSYAKGYSHLSGYYCWQCQLCGQCGMGSSSPRQDLLNWALKNHVCKNVEENYSVH